MREEWNAWGQVIFLLKKTKAVSEEDCSSSSFGEATTDGQKLIVAIIEWGDKLVKFKGSLPHLTS